MACSRAARLEGPQRARPAAGLLARPNAPLPFSSPTRRSPAPPHGPRLNQRVDNEHNLPGRRRVGGRTARPRSSAPAAAQPVFVPLRQTCLTAPAHLHTLPHYGAIQPTEHN